MIPPVDGKIKVCFTMVLHPLKGEWIRVGQAYTSKEGAKTWIPFVKGYWKGCRTKLSSCTLTYKDGKLTQKCKDILDKKYNIEA